jgi:hypothetical protein
MTLLHLIGFGLVGLGILVIIVLFIMIGWGPSPWEGDE